MGFDKKIVNKVYILLRPESIERAVEYMTEINDIYQHNFFESNNLENKNLCYICQKQKQNHLDYIKDDILNEEQNNIIINDDIQEIKNEDNLLILEDKCNICNEAIKKEDREENKIQCGHLFCSNCYFEYLKVLINEGKVEKINCMDFGCDQILSDEFIIFHISMDNNLTNKFIRYKKRIEILNDENKKMCPFPDCDSFLYSSKLTKYVECEKGHMYCYNS